MSNTKYSSVNFGSIKADLTTVGYTLKNFDDTDKVARATADVVEIGTSTGIFAVEFTLNDDSWNGLILWDTGEGAPSYAVDERFSQLNAIQNETDKIRTIWNTIQQQADYEGELLRRLAGMDENFKNIPNTHMLEKVLKSAQETGMSIFELNKSMMENMQGLETVFRSKKEIDLRPQMKSLSQSFIPLHTNHLEVMKTVRGIHFPKFDDKPLMNKLVDIQKSMNMSDKLEKIKKEIVMEIRNSILLITKTIRKVFKR